MKRNKLTLSTSQLSIETPGQNLQYFLLDFAKAELPAYQLTISENSHLDLLIIGPYKVSDLEIKLEANAKVKLQFEVNSQTSNWSIKTSLLAGSHLEFSTLDLLPHTHHALIEVNLKETGSKLVWNIGSLTKLKTSKHYTINFMHEAKHTEADMNNNGVCEDQSTLIFSGRSHIYQGCAFSKTHQHTKVVVFNENCHGRADPILGIDENEVEASHAAIVGRVNEEHLYYLQSRGLNEKESKTLIKHGYLISIIHRFSDEELQKALAESL